MSEAPELQIIGAQYAVSGESMDLSNVDLRVATQRHAEDEMRRFIESEGLRVGAKEKFVITWICQIEAAVLPKE